MTEPTQELLDDIFRRRVLQARRTPPDQRLVECLDLFDRARSLMRDGIRHQFPDADEAEIDKILGQRLNRIRCIEEHGIYRPADEEVSE
ncbi:MAG: hypothetical protein ACE5KM_15275 [Planctomycetaceae bacterium]